jgi:hypothetical protein
LRVDIREGEMGLKSTRSGFARAALAVLILLIVVDASSLITEMRFFSPSPVVSQDGSAPVPQDSIRDPRIDDAFRRAAAVLPAAATCVVDKDSWHEDYFRASYIMMPRHVWPYADRASGAPTQADLARAVKLHAATCLLLSATSPVPGGVVRRTRGAYSLFVIDAAARN